MLVEAPEKAGEKGPLSIAWLNGQKSHFERSFPGSFEHARVGQAIRDRERRLVVCGDHAHQLVINRGDQVRVLFMELVDDSGSRVVVLGKLANERLEVEPVNLLKFGLALACLKR